jgi:predicted transcriptional regulator
MGTTTMGVKLDDATRERIKFAASRIDRTPHWLIKQAIFNYLEKLENDETLPELPALLAGAANESDDASSRSMSRGSHSSNLPSRFCRSPSPGPRLPPLTAGQKPTPSLCCWSRRACRSR